MAGRRGRKGPLATLAALSCAIAWSHGCGIDLSKDELAGRPCKNGVCLPGYVCSEANICVLAGTGGTLGSGGSAGEGGTDGTGGSTEGAGGTGGSGGTDLDATNDVSDASDANHDQSIDANGGTAGSDGSVDSGGSAGAAADSGMNRWPGIGCSQLTCTQAEICCVRTYPGFPEPPPPAEFRCAAPGTTCAYTLQCDGDHDCPAGQACCVASTAGGPVASCAASCGLPQYRVECTKPEHCGTGLVCCAVNFQINRFDAFLCRPSCNGFTDRVVCTAEANCTAAQNCEPSAVLPGFKTCQP
jgi:hypothetical protein